jgi:hypothetical protein
MAWADKTIRVPLVSQVEIHKSWVKDADVYEYDSALAVPSVTQPTDDHPVGIERAFRRCNLALLCRSGDLRVQDEDSRANTRET